ncbi:SCO5918 family protein [Streptomyces sp. NBC_01373]|uniref:SCO5918 family protein n=1 Tax=Streptomyces sp. NBC_01373 TaxID=2903843 RepID=UPI002256C2C9|nr:SCO5918 family protein [Streptomyces sp. NBC_01373]MCX4699256.1 SCO5918 family protein [Streptomyces sp. NBC_01373]
MRCVIARFPFDLVKSEVESKMAGIRPEEVTGACVVIGRKVFPVKQVGEVITRQDRRDFTAAEVTRALVRLGFTCHATPPQAQSPAPAPAPAQSESQPQPQSPLASGSTPDPFGGIGG